MPLADADVLDSPARVANQADGLNPSLQLAGESRRQVELRMQSAGRIPNPHPIGSLFSVFRSQFSAEITSANSRQMGNSCDCPKMNRFSIARLRDKGCLP